MGVFFAIILYIFLLVFISFVFKKKNSHQEYFKGGNSSPWYIISIGMIGTSISGVSFISVPAWVESTQFTYMQMVIGFFFGYIFVAYVLLPIYYRLNLISIYAYLKERLGNYSYKTASTFFILSKSVSATVRIYLVFLVLKTFILDKLVGIPIPFFILVLFFMFFIGLYTYRSGIKTIIWTDFIQTILFITALLLMIYHLTPLLNLQSLNSTYHLVATSEYAQMFEFKDWKSKQCFFKQFLSGIFVVIVMTGLDQDMMQKNLSCKNLKEAKKNMLTYGFLFIPINLLFLLLGALLLIYIRQENLALTMLGDDLLPTIIFENMLNSSFLPYVFAVGLLAAALSSVDSAITSLTTSFYIDILEEKIENNSKKKYRKRTFIHIGFCVFFSILILLFQTFNNKSTIDLIYTLVSYTYGPLLGMFFFGIFTKKDLKDKYVPIVCILSLLAVISLNYSSNLFLNYKFGYELLIINGLFTFVGLILIREKKI